MLLPCHRHQTMDDSIATLSPHPPSRATRRRRDLLCGAAAMLLGPRRSSANAGPAFRTLKTGRLLIATYFVNPPFEFISGQHRVVFEVDLMPEVARRRGLKPAFVN